MSDPLQGTDVLAVTFESRLKEMLGEASRRSRSFSAPYAQLWHALEKMAGGGKKVRPRLLMDAYEALGGGDERVAVDAACAMELLHLALVIHDDVIDRDLVRRGEMNITGVFAQEAIARGLAPDEARAWGEASSILAGDLMLTMAHSALARLEIDRERRLAILDIFADTVFESAAGEHYDVWLSTHLAPASAQDVLLMTDQKTAAYSFQAPLVLAAVLAGAGEHLIAELTAIARHIGVIYQLRDDVLGLFGDEGDTGKSTLSDLREGKETLLVAYARADPAWDEVSHLFGDAELSIVDGDRLRRVIDESGALALVETAIADRCTIVHALLEESVLPHRLRDRLTELTSACASRTS